MKNEAKYLNVLFGRDVEYLFFNSKHFIYYEEADPSQCETTKINYLVAGAFPVSRVQN